MRECFLSSVGGQEIIKPRNGLCIELTNITLIIDNDRDNDFSVVDNLDVEIMLCRKIHNFGWVRIKGDMHSSTKMARS